MRNGILIGVALGVLALSVPAGAQDETGTLAGCVSDAARSPLPGVTVQVTGANVDRKVATVADGCFRVSDLPPATYLLVATLTGFSAVVRDELAVRAGALTRVDVRMRVAPQCECVTLPTPTVSSLWQKADVVAQIRIASHDYRPEDTITETVTHTATVLRVWKDTWWTTEVRSTLRFVQQQREHPEPYVVGQEFILFLTANGPGPFHISGAFAVQDGRIHSAAVDGYQGKSMDDLVEEILALVEK